MFIRTFFELKFYTLNNINICFVYVDMQIFKILCTKCM